MPIQFEKRLESKIKVGSAVITPIKKNLKVTFPGSSGGLVWSRPAAVLVRTRNGVEQEFPIHDITRRAQITVLGFGLLGALLIWMVNKARR